MATVENPIVKLPTDTPNDLIKLTALEQLRSEILELKVDDAAGFVQMAELKKSVERFISDVEEEYDPQVKSAKEHWELLKSRRDRHIKPATTFVLQPALDKMADYNRRKREAAEAEERRLNEEKRRKEAAEAEERRIAADADAKRERQEREAKAAADKLIADKKAEEDSKAAKKKAEDDKKAREKEIADAREKGIVNKKEADKLAKEAADKAAAEKKKAEEDAAQKKKEAENLAAREKQRAEEEETERKRLAAEEEQTKLDNFQAVTVKAERTTVAGHKSGGNWRWKWRGQPMQALEQVPRHLLYPENILDVEKFPGISAMVKRKKSKELAEAECPSIEVFYVDR